MTVSMYHIATRGKRILCWCVLIAYWCRVWYDICNYQYDDFWPCNTKSSSGFLKVWLRLRDNIFVCLRKCLNLHTRIILRHLTLKDSSKKGPSWIKFKRVIYADVGYRCGLERSRRYTSYCFTMAGHDPEKFDGMFLAMCQRCEKGIDEVAFFF